MQNNIHFKVLSSRDPQDFELLVCHWLADGFSLFGEPCCVKTDSGVTLLVQVVVREN